MITTLVEYEKALEELRTLEERLERLRREHPLGENGLTKAGVRKLIARLHEELGMFEGSVEAKSETLTEASHESDQP